MPRCPDLTIFMLTDDDDDNDDKDRQTRPIILPLAHARGVNIQCHIHVYYACRLAHKYNACMYMYVCALIYQLTV